MEPSSLRRSILPRRPREILRDGPNIATGGHVDLAITAEHDTAVETRVALERVGHEKVSDVDERASLEPAPRERRCAHAVSDGLGIGEVDEAIVGKPGMEGHIHEAAVAVGPDLWHAGDGLRVKHSAANDAEATGPLGNQHVAVGEEREGPWMREPLGHDADADLVLLGCIEHPWSRTQTAAPVRRQAVVAGRG